MAPGSLAAGMGRGVWGVTLEHAQHSREGLWDTLPAPVKGHLRRLRQELQEKEKVIESLEAKLQERCESPGSSRPPSESSRSATSTSFVSEGLEPCSDGDVASECSQCHEEPARLAGTGGCPGGSLQPLCSVWVLAVIGAHQAWAGAARGAPCSSASPRRVSTQHPGLQGSVSGSPAVVPQSCKAGT